MEMTGLRAGMAQTAASGSSGGAASGTAGAGMQKLENAAREFEGVMMASIWRAWNKSNQMGNPQDEIGSSMTGMSMEMAAIAMAEKGGFGLAKMIVNSLKGDVAGQSPKSSS
jgi:Rod binding domain-containing protein